MTPSYRTCKKLGIILKTADHPGFDCNMTEAVKFAEIDASAEVWADRYAVSCADGHFSKMDVCRLEGRGKAKPMADRKKAEFQDLRHRLCD